MCLSIFDIKAEELKFKKSISQNWWKYFGAGKEFKQNAGSVIIAKCLMKFRGLEHWEGKAADQLGASGSE